MILFIFCIFLNQSHASLPKNGSSVLLKPSVDEKQAIDPKREEIVDSLKTLKKTRIQITRSSLAEESGNLPSYLRNVSRSDDADSQVYIAGKTVNPMVGVRAGDMFKAIIDQAITASSTVPTPIRAQIISGSLKGSFFVGEATLDKELKRVLLSFTKIRKSDSSLYSVRASGLSLEGSVGLTGEYHSEMGKFFLGELASATAAGMLDSTINRNQNALGNYVQEPSLSNSAKTGAVTALSKTADHFAEQTKQAPEYTKVEGFQEIKVLITEDPLEVGGN